MARKSSRRQRKTPTKNYQPWVSHLVTFIIGTLAGIGISQFDSPSSGTGVNSIAQAPQQTAEQSAIIQQLETHLTHAPEDVETRIRLGNAYFDSKDFTSAIIHYAQALELQPGNPNVIVDMGIAYRRVGQSDVAVKKFRDALVLDSLHVNARYNLGLVAKWDLNDNQTAIEAWETLLRLNPNHPRAAAIRTEIASMKMGN